MPRIFLCAVATAFALAAGCAEPTRDPAPTSAAKPAPAVDRAQHCQSICARAVGCGIEAAENLSRTNLKEVALVTQLKNEREASTRACSAECNQGEIEAQDETALVASSHCLEQTTCDLFSRCLGDARDVAKRR